MTDIATVIVRDERQRQDAFAVRIAVFVEEQGIAREDELDDEDDTAVHCVAYASDVPIGAGRLLLRGGYAKIGRMAVLAPHRGRGVGARVLEGLEAEGRRRGREEFRLSAQLTARGFYERAGYVAEGDVYDDVGIPHIDMVKGAGSGRT